MRLVALALMSVFLGCSKLPDVQVVSGDPALSRRTDGAIMYGLESFSGYLITYDDQGKLYSKSGYLNGFLEGESLGYYPNGNTREIRYYEKGEKDGKHVGFFEDGTPKFEYYFENGLSVGAHRDWYASGQLAQEMNFVDGKQQGIQKVWRIDGKLRSNYVIASDGRRYGLVGIKRCKNIDTEEELIKPLTAQTSEILNGFQ